MTVAIEPVRDFEEAIRWAEISSEALGFDLPDAEELLSRYDLADLRVARTGGELAGGAFFLPMAQYFGGRAVPMSGVHAVGIAAEHRGRGVGGALMREAMLELAERGVPISCLYPATQPIYRAAGFEQAGTWTRWALPASALTDRDRELPVERVGVDDADDLATAYEAQARVSPGHLVRTSWNWRRTLQLFGGGPKSYRVREGGKTTGYLAYWAKRRTDRFHVSDYYVELVANTPAAAARLRALLADHRSMVDTLHIAGPPGGAPFLPLGEQRATVDVMMRWMLRLVDVRAALEARGYPPGLTARLELEVEDDLLAKNRGRITLEVSEGSGRVTDGGGGTLEAHVRGLAPLYSGHLDATSLAALGLVEGSADALATASAIFAGPAPWMPEIF